MTSHMISHIDRIYGIITELEQHETAWSYNTFHANVYRRSNC